MGEIVEAHIPFFLSSMSAQSVVAWGMARNALIEELTAAIHAGKVKVVEQLIAQRADVNGKSSRGAAPLLNAILRGHRDIFDLLLRSGASPTVKHDKHNLLHMLAFEKGRRIEFVEPLIEAGVDPNELGGHSGWSAVRLAVWERNPKLLSALLASPSIDTASPEYQTAIDLARNVLEASVKELESRRKHVPVPKKAAAKKPGVGPEDENADILRTELNQFEDSLEDEDSVCSLPATGEELSAAAQVLGLTHAADFIAAKVKGKKKLTTLEPIWEAWRGSQPGAGPSLEKAASKGGAHKPSSSAKQGHR